MDKIKLPNRDGSDLYLINKGDYWKLEGPELYTTYLRIIGDFPNEVVAIDPPGGPFMAIGDVFSNKRITDFKWEEGIGVKIYLEDATD